MQESESVKIGELAKRLEITPRTIRYYEEIGLMPPAVRLRGGARVYGPDEILRLRFILKLKELGITLEEMRELALIYQKVKSPQKLWPRLVQMLDGHLQKIDEKISRITALRKEIAQYRVRIVKDIQDEQQ